MKRTIGTTKRNHFWKRSALSGVLAFGLAVASPAAVFAEDASAAASKEQLDRPQVLNLLSSLHVSGTPRSALESLSIPAMIDRKSVV